MLGPIDYVVLGFEKNTFDGSIMKELQKAVDDGIIRVIDVLFIIRDEDGTVVEGEYEDQSPDLRETFDALDREPNLPLLTEDDIEKIGAKMENDTAAAVLVIEHVWAKGLKKAIINAGGFLVDDGRIHPEAVSNAVRELQAA